MDVRKRQIWRWMGAIAVSALLLPSCLVNPVPTPQSGGSSALDSLPAGGKQDGASSDALGGKDAAPGDGVAAGVTLATVQATATDGAIDASVAGGVHVAKVASGALSTAKLVVVLPDAGRLATQYDAIATAAALQGHRVLVLATPVAAQVACAGDGTCLEFARQEQLDGQDRTPKITVTTPDCLENRLVKALTWLDKNRPGENWGKFYNGSTPYWADIAVAGHGEGASVAAMLAKHETLWRVALLGGPTDSGGSQPAPWLAAGGQTPVTAWRAFAHTADPAWGIVIAAWTSLGIGTSSSAASVDGGQQPDISAHLLTTAMNVPDPHAAIALDGALPTDASASQHLRTAWNVLFWPF